jgi:DNA-binding response OmpR family regulator
MFVLRRIKERTVFLLEDDPLIVSDIEATLADFGWRVSHRANTLEDGMRIARSALFDVAIVDVNLGGRESYPVALSVSERNIPLILCSGYALQALRDRFPDVLILPKPFPAETLRAMLEQVSTTCH